MADLGAIFSTVSRASSLAFELYKLATSNPHGTNHLSKVARSISTFSSTVKELATVIRENDTIPSPEAIETLEDILNQCNVVFIEIETIAKGDNPQDSVKKDGYDSNGSHVPRLDTAEVVRLHYLQAHLDSLKSTTFVMQQTLYTAQIIMWARTRPSISPQQAATAVANEKTQLENLVIEQQMSILSASRLYEPIRPDARLLMEKDSSKSIATRETGAPKPLDLHRYQERFLTSLYTSESREEDWLPAVCGISKSHLERLLERWTCLRQFHEKLADEERLMEAEKRENQQPTVESDSEDEFERGLRYSANGARLATPMPRRPPSVQPLFTEANTLPIPVPGSKFGPTAPLSPASSYGVSPRSSGNALVSPIPSGYSPVSPRSSISSLPVEAAAAAEAKDKDDELSLGIPWQLCTRKHHWQYVDTKVESSNTDLSPATAYTDRNGWTEILASWVCKEALNEKQYNYTQVQKVQQDGRRTKLETCFCIDQPLHFEQVQEIVERTVEIYRKSHRSPSPNKRRTSFDRQISRREDQDKTPLANQHQRPSLERSTTFAFPPPPPHPPMLDRTLSLPGSKPANHPMLSPNLNTPPIAIPFPTAPYAGKPPYSPQLPPHSPQTTPYSPTAFYPHVPPAPVGGIPLDPRRLSNNALPPPSPLRHSLSQPQPQSHSHSNRTRDRDDHYSSASTTSESDTTTRSKHRSRSRRQSSSHKNKHRTVGTLATVGGLAALLDGIVDLGVL